MIRWGLLIALCITALGWSGRSALSARDAAHRAAADLAETRSQVEQLLALRAAVPADRKPGSGLAARVSAVLSRCGLPASVLSSISPESGVEASAGYRRRHATLALAGVTLPQVGVFLQTWRSAEPAWVVGSLELTPAPPQSPTPGADLPLRCTIGLDAVYTEQAGAKS